MHESLLGYFFYQRFKANDDYTEICTLYGEQMNILYKKIKHIQRILFFFSFYQNCLFNINTELNLKVHGRFDHMLLSMHHIWRDFRNC